MGVPRRDERAEQAALRATRLRGRRRVRTGRRAAAVADVAGAEVASVRPSAGHPRRVPLQEHAEHAGVDPLPTGYEPRPDRPWWGRHVHELRWQAELARLLVDPIYRGVGVPRGDGSPVLLIPGFLVGDESLGVLAAWLKRIGYQPRRA